MTGAYILFSQKNGHREFFGNLSEKNATELGAIAIKGVYEAVNAHPTTLMLFTWAMPLGILVRALSVPLFLP